MTGGPSLWGHDRDWLPADQLASTRAVRARLAAAGQRQPVQAIEDWKYQQLEIEDFTGLPEEAREREVNRIATADAETGFNLSQGPLLRVKVLKLQEEEHVLLFTMHHIVSDAWSMDILIREVGALYQAYSAGELSSLAELPEWA